MSDHIKLLERFGQGTDLLSAAIDGLAPGEADFRIAPDKWTIRQLAAHVADSELVTGMRYRQVIAEDSPTLQGYDQNLWATRLDYSRRDPAEAAVTYRQLRAQSYELMKHLPAEDFERPGTHSERGQLTLMGLLRTYVEHAEKHAEQIRDIREAFAAQSKGQGA